MHLTGKQILLLFIPFLVSGFVYYFDTDIVKNVKHLFPSYEGYTNKTLDRKAEIYLKILSKDKIYQDIKEKMKNRETSTHWIAQDVLYKEFTNKQEVLQSDNSKTKIAKVHSWSLQAVFNKKKVAIINSKIVKLGSYINGAKLIYLEENRVLIQYNKGSKKWIHLFQ